MTRYFIIWSLLHLWISLTLEVSIINSNIDNVRFIQLSQKNGWQPLVGQDHTGGNSPSNNYQIAHSYIDKKENYKLKQHRRQHESLPQYDYNPLSVLGSFSIFGHVLPKNREGEEVKTRHESGNKNKYDFLVPPPRQKIEHYQKLKLPTDPYGSSAHNRDIYTPLDNQFKFIPTVSGSPSIIKQHPPIRDGDGSHIVHQHSFMVDSQKTPHSQLSVWPQNPHDNGDLFRTNFFRQHQANVDGNNHYYTQISHPPLSKPFQDNRVHSSTEQNNKIAGDFATRNPILSYPSATSSSQRNEFVSIRTVDLKNVNRPHFHFEQNSSGKQLLDDFASATIAPSSITRKKSPFSEVLPKLIKTTQFNAPNISIEKIEPVTQFLNSRIIPQKISPIIQKIPPETPESISLKHFNEQQYVLQQQLLERDRQKLEDLQRHRHKHVGYKLLTDQIATDSATRKANIENDFGTYELVKLTNEKKNFTINIMPTITKTTEDYKAKNSEIYEYVVVHERPIMLNYLREEIIATTDNIDFENIRNNVLHQENSNKQLYKQTDRAKNSSGLIPNINFDTTIATIRPDNRWPILEELTTEGQSSLISPVASDLVTYTVVNNTRKASTIKMREQSRDPPRRRKPSLKTEYTSSSSISIEPTLSSVQSSLHIFGLPHNTSPFQVSTQPISSTISNIELSPNPIKYLTIIHEDEGYRLSTSGEPITTKVDSNLVKSVTVSSNDITSISHLSSTLNNYLEKITTQAPVAITTSTASARSTTRSILQRPTATTSGTTTTTTPDYTYSIESLENLFNLTDTIDDGKTNTQTLKLLSTTNTEKSNSNEFSTISPGDSEITAKTTYRLRLMKTGNNTRPRFSVKDYKSRLDYRNQLSQNLTTESTSSATVSMKLKGKYKYTPRTSYTKIKMPMSIHTPKLHNLTDIKDVKKSKIFMKRPFNIGNYRTGGFDNSNSNGTDFQKPLNLIPIKNNKFVHAIYRRPLLKTTAQLNQGMKKNRTNMQNNFDSELTTVYSIESNTEIFSIEMETSQVNASEMKINKRENVTAIQYSKGTPISETVRPHDIEKLGIDDKPVTIENNSTVSEIILQPGQQSSMQSDEEVFVKASQSVADLTSSASALYNQPGMFKALSTVAILNNNVGRKILTPVMDEPSLPIETFFRELSNKE